MMDKIHKVSKEKSQSKTPKAKKGWNVWFLKNIFGNNMSDYINLLKRLKFKDSMLYCDFTLTSLIFGSINQRPVTYWSNTTEK
jgi:hypothetical protein